MCLNNLPHAPDGMWFDPLESGLRKGICGEGSKVEVRIGAFPPRESESAAES